MSESKIELVKWNCPACGGFGGTAGGNLQKAQEHANKCGAPVEAEITRTVISHVMVAPQNQEGYWICPASHSFRYQAPPAWPPWCPHLGCNAEGEFTWVPKDLYDKPSNTKPHDPDNVPPL